MACVAKAARPRPEFEWYIGETRIEGETTDSSEDVDEAGKGDFVQSLRYYADPRHNGQALKCVVTHPAYSKQQLADGDNTRQKLLQLFCEWQQGRQRRKKKILFCEIGLLRIEKK